MSQDISHQSYQIPKALSVYSVKACAQEIAELSDVVHFDFADCEEIDGAGIQLLLCVVNTRAVHNKQAIFTNISDEVLSVMRYFGDAAFCGCLHHEGKL